MRCSTLAGIGEFQTLGGASTETTGSGGRIAVYSERSTDFRGEFKAFGGYSKQDPYNSTTRGAAGTVFLQSKNPVDNSYYKLVINGEFQLNFVILLI